MAPKRPSLIQDAPAASSSEEQFTDAEVEFTEEEESDSGPEPAQKSPTTMPLKKPDTAAAESSSDEDEGTESGSDSDDGPPVSVVNPNSKLMHDTFMIKKARTKASCMPAPPAIYGPKSVAKRPFEKTGDEKSPKRIKNKEEPESNSSKDGAKKPLFQRVWTEEDELVILKGMIEYIAKARANPYNNVDAFHDLIKEGLHIAVTRSQLMDKMRRLKKKFVNNSLKKKNGDARTFSKAFEQKSFDISMKIWGNEANAGLFDQITKPSGNAKKFLPAAKGEASASLITPKPAKKALAPCAEADLGDAKVSNESFLLDMSITHDEPNAKLIKEGLSLVDDAKKAELVKKWRKLQCEEADIFLRRVNLMAEQTKLLLDKQVRKEKPGDRVTALQQLVSPFGKTDIASVLHDYTKYLHDQVNVLTSPYMKDHVALI